MISSFYMIKFCACLSQIVVRFSSSFCGKLDSLNSKTSQINRVTETVLTSFLWFDDDFCAKGCSSAPGRCLAH